MRAISLSTARNNESHALWNSKCAQDAGTPFFAISFTKNCSSNLDKAPSALLPTYETDVSITSGKLMDGLDKLLITVNKFESNCGQDVGHDSEGKLVNNSEQYKRVRSAIVPSKSDKCEAEGCSDQIIVTGHSGANIACVEVNSAKVQSATESKNKYKNINWAFENRTRQEILDGRNSSMVDGFVELSGSKVVLGHHADKSSNNNGSLLKAEESEEKVSGSTANVEAKGIAGLMITRSIQGATATSSAQFSDRGARVAKEGLAVAQNADTLPANMYDGNHGGISHATSERSPMLLAATSNAIEVGVVNGTHGWLKIRSEIEHGVVTTSIATKSPAIQEMLHHELPTLSAFLKEEKIADGPVVIKPLPPGAEDIDHEAGHHGRRESGYQQPRKENHGTDPDTTGSISNGEQDEMSRVSRGMGQYLSLLPVITGGLGGWLNVRV